MTCPRCQQDNPTHARFCLGCGTRLALAGGACGAELPGDARFCLQCGHAVAGSAAAPIWSPTPERYTPRHLADDVPRDGHDLLAMTLRRLRTKRRMSQQSLAAKSGLSREYVARLEIGQHNPSLATLQKLAKALGVPVTALLE